MSQRIQITRIDKLKKYRSFEEFLLVEEMSGDPVSEKEIGSLVASIIGILTLGYHAYGDDYPDSAYLDHVEHIVCKADMITDVNKTLVIENLCLAICSGMGPVKIRARLMNVFKHLSKKFPKEMAATYQKHKVMNKFRP